MKLTLNTRGLDAGDEIWAIHHSLIVQKEPMENHLKKKVVLDFKFRGNMCRHGILQRDWYFLIDVIN